MFFTSPHPGQRSVHPSHPAPLIAPRCYIRLRRVISSSGATHEHMRWDRNGFVNILEQNMQQGAKKNFDITSTQSLADPYSTFGTPFDYESVMHHVVLKNGNTNILTYWQTTAIGPPTKCCNEPQLSLLKSVNRDVCPEFSALVTTKLFHRLFEVNCWFAIFQTCSWNWKRFIKLESLLWMVLMEPIFD